MTSSSNNPFDNPDRLKFAKKQRAILGWIPHIRSTLPPFVKVGVQVTIHENVYFTEGFGYARDENGKWLHIPHAGGISIGDNVDIYEQTTINRGAVGDTTIGSGTKIDHHCHIGHNSRIGENCIICAGVILAGSVIIGDNVWIGPGSTVKNKVLVGKDCYIGSNSNVVEDVQYHHLAKGNPARSEYREYLPHIKIG